MPNVIVTQALCDTIKKYRKEAKIRGDALSRTLKKNTSFISQLENQKINTINTNLLYDIFNEIMPKESKEEKYDKITKIIDDLCLQLSDEELKRQEWMRVMDLQYRIIPIPHTIPKYIEESLININMTGKELVYIINQNKPLLADSTIKYDELEDNKVYFTRTNNSSRLQIKFNLPETYIDDILSRKIVRENYVKIQVIILTLLHQKGMPYSEAFDNSIKILAEHKFYTMLYKQTLNTKKDYENMAPHDIEFNQKLKTLSTILSSINDRQPDFLNEILETFIENILKEPNITFSVISKDITSLREMSKDNKIEFIQDYKKLISKYQLNSKDDIPPIETF